MERKKMIIAGIVIVLVLLLAVTGYGTYKSGKTINKLDGSKWEEDTTNNMYQLSQDKDDKTYNVAYTPGSPGGAEPSGFSGTFDVGFMGGITYGTFKGSRSSDGGTITWTGDGAPGKWTLQTS